eukprot:Hpha_TRINITY_DN16307_c2_g6::TRINITY_DN16307_c2_g6_i1::g.59361::m.59361
MVGVRATRNRRRRGQGNGNCFRCGMPGHFARECTSEWTPKNQKVLSSSPGGGHEYATIPSPPSHSPFTSGASPLSSPMMAGPPGVWGPCMTQWWDHTAAHCDPMSYFGCSHGPCCAHGCTQLREAHSWESLDTMQTALETDPLQAAAQDISPQVHNNSQAESFDYSYAPPQEPPQELSQEQPPQVAWETEPDPPASVTTSANGDFVGTNGLLLNSGRYQVNRVLGKGTFATCVQADDQLTGQAVAIKVVRADSKALADSEEEVRILKQLASQTLAGCKSLVRLITTFPVNSHKCLVTPLYGESLQSLIQRRPEGLDWEDVMLASRGMCEALGLVHSVGVIHCDIKPENILCRKGASVKNGVTLCDFGGAYCDTDSKPKLIQTQYYRAPEVLLGTAWSYSADVWSAGCVVFELATGDTLFRPRDVREHVRSIPPVLDAPWPSRMISQTSVPLRQRLFCPRTHRPLPGIGANSLPMTSRLSKSGGGSLAPLLRWMLTVDPQCRATAADAEQEIAQIADSSSSASD